MSFCEGYYYKKTMKHILYCQKCKAYTMKQVCPKCGTKTIQKKPAKFSPEDPYGKYRRKAKKEQGLL